MTKTVLLRETPIRRDIKDLQIPPQIDEIMDNIDEERAANSYDQYIGAEVVLPDQKGEKIMGKVRKCVRQNDTSTGKGKYDAMYDKSLYEVEYPDGTIDQQSANIMDDNMLSQVDSEGHHYQVLNEVTDHKKDDSDISKVDGFIKSISGNLHWKLMTCGWKLLVKWKYISVDWFPIKYLKQSNPVDLAEYVV